MSSHREAPEISKDPVADNTDVYAFVSPDAPNTVTIIANFIPLQKPDGGPNFYEFGDDVVYEIHIGNRGDAHSDVTYQFIFQTKVRNPETFLYNTGPIASIADHNWNRRQFYRVRRVVRGGAGQNLATGLTCPPVNIGPRSTPDYEKNLGAPAVHRLPGNRKVFAGQRAEGFFVDLGSIFDLLTLRPLQTAHLIQLIPSVNAMGVNGSQGFNIHTIAIQVPITDLTRGGHPATDVMDPRSVIGVWATASRRKSQVLEDDGSRASFGPFVQVSRLGNPLFNEVIVPMGDKDRWNRLHPSADAQFTHYAADPEVAHLLPVLYPGAFPNLAAYTASKKPRADIVAILMTGIPAKIIPGFQNFTGGTQADILRLNVAVKPASKPNNLGLLGGDIAGFPNGRRIADDVVTIELQALAGATIPLVDPTFTPDAVIPAVTDDTTNTNSAYLNRFPYLGTPAGGFQTIPAIPKT